MTMQRRLARAGFTLTRDYSVPLARVWDAFAATYDMWLDEVHMSTSVASFEFEPIDEGTRFTHVEHGVFFDQFWADAPQREEGSRGLLAALADHLA
jgi:hypothetical protein